MTVTIWCDGLCEPKNPGGYATWGWVAFDDIAGKEIATGKGCLGFGPGMTNNLAEYTAVIGALLWAYRNGHTGCTLYTDSKLVVEQANGHWQVHAEALRPLHARVVKGLNQLRAFLEWVPREQNQRADALSREAYREACKANGVSSRDRTDWVDGAPYINALMAIDSKEGIEVSEWEANFLNDTLKKCPDLLSPKQARVVRRMAEKYLSAEAFAELTGQGRLL